MTCVFNILKSCFTNFESGTVEKNDISIQICPLFCSIESISCMLMVWRCKYRGGFYQSQHTLQMKAMLPLQSIGHPHPKPIKLQQAGWPLLSMCICCSGVMTTPVVSGCQWGSQWVPYATEEHTAIWHFLLSLRGCWYQYHGSLIIRNTW